MENVLKGLSSKKCLVFLDGIILIGKSVDDHIQRLGEVFKSVVSRKMNNMKTKTSDW